MQSQGAAQIDRESVIAWKDVFCHLPFTNLSVGHNRAHFCCWATQKYNSIGFYGDDIGVEDLWNHPTLVEAREFMLAGQAEKVCRPNCPHLAGGGVKSAFLRDPVKLQKGDQDG